MPLVIHLGRRALDRNALYDYELARRLLARHRAERIEAQESRRGRFRGIATRLSAAKRRFFAVLRDERMGGRLVGDDIVRFAKARSHAINSQSFMSVTYCCAGTTSRVAKPLEAKSQAPGRSGAQIMGCGVDVPRRGVYSQGMQPKHLLQDILARGVRKFSREFVSPVSARHIEPSILSSVDDQDHRSQPSERLLDVALSSVAHARTVSLASVVERMRGRFPAEYPEIWPGEHYKRLAGLVSTLKPKTIIEVGTAEGISALSMLPFMERGARLFSYDVVSWKEYPRPCLVDDDFADGRLTQILVDLSTEQGFEGNRSILRDADLIFLDGPKDGTFEPEFMRRIGEMDFRHAPIVVFDDIRLWNMLSFWRQLSWPKLDLTSFGHWSGSGLTEPPR